jgi:hypothetical protein
LHYHSKDILTIHRECKWIISYYIKQPVPLSLPEITRITQESLQKPKNRNEISVYNWTYINFPILQEKFIALKSFIKQRATAIADKSMLSSAAELKAWDSMLCVSLVITTCHVLELQLEKTALKYAEYL